MPTFAEFQAELMQTIFSVWPEITPPSEDPCRFFTTLQAMSESFVERVEDGRTALPCVVLEIGKFRHSRSTFGNRAPIYFAPVVVYYIGQLSPSLAQPQVDAKLWQLARAIDFGAFQTFDAHEEALGDVDTSPSCPANAALAGKAKGPFVAGSVSWDPGLVIALEMPD